MKRSLFNFITVLSLLLCVATAGLWLPSYWYDDVLAFPISELPPSVRSDEGTVLLCWPTMSTSIISLPKKTFWGIGNLGVVVNDDDLFFRSLGLPTNGGHSEVTN